MKKIYSIILIVILFCIKSFAQITLVQFSTGFTQPVDIKNAGDNRIFIVERAGYIKIIDSVGVHRPGNFLDIHLEVESSYGEEGLLGVAFAPDYATSGNFYCYYTKKNTWAVTISRFHVSATNPDSADASSEQELISIYHHFAQNHNGGDLAFGPDGYLYFGTGDGGSGNDPGNRSQNLDTLLGKMMRIDVSGGGAYSIPPSNPFVGVSGRDEIWARGLRNPWRWGFDRWNGDLWIGDVGQDAYEEIDHQPASSTGGENYGWHCYEGFVHTSGVTSCSPTDTTNPVLAVAQTTGACAMIGGYVYRGASYSNMFGKYFFSDECLANMKYIVADGSAGFTPVNLGVLATGTTNVGFGEDAWGELYMADINGKIFKFHGQSCSPVAYLSNLDTIFVCGASQTTLHTPAGSGFHYSWTWSGGIIITDSSAIQVSQDGDYSVTVVDTGGCSNTSSTVHVSFVSLPVVSFSGLDTMYCVFDSPVTLAPIPAGGTFSGAGISGNAFDPAVAGVGFDTITYTYSDVHGCSNSISQSVHVDICQGIRENSFANFSLFPNPNDGNFELRFYLLKDELINLEATNVLGETVYKEQVHLNSGSHHLNLKIHDLKAGLYSLKMSNEKGSIVKNFVVR